MQRRKFLIGTGSIAAGGAAVVGSGAFTSAESGERDVEVSTTADSSSFLAIYTSDSDTAADDPEGTNPNGRYASETDDPGTIELHFNEDARGTFPTGDGVNPGSVYTFDDVFRIRNDAAVNGGPTGPTEVDVWLNTSGLPGVEFYAEGDTDDRLEESLWSQGGKKSNFNSGQSGLQVGVKIVEEDYDEDSVSGTVVVNAEKSPSSVRDD
ncbi:DUF1102 domain-containing protein [Halalkalirubrum salinum]|uniref:DUF1102 domain-containing protein n=1 Tax=Halalkalirubrum salinum TaxID=2563889 RepID=UPI0010FB54A3|nr:DUF1102 domain-containing protein [Halalkalirubrum salinum]